MRIIQKIKAFRHKAYIMLFSHMPIKNNKIIIWADSFKHFGCNPKYIALYLIEHYPEKFDIVWVLNRDIKIPSDFPSEIRIVRYFSIKYLKELYTSKFIICNSRIFDSYYRKKRTEQIYIQTWHSSLRLKMIEKDAELPISYVQQAKKDSNKTNLLISGCEFSTQIFKRAFWYNGEILKSGTPRCDIFFNNHDKARKKVFDYYKIEYSKKLLLYAPTFRSDNKADLNGFDFETLKSRLNNSKDDWVMACRLHPNIIYPQDMKNCIQMTEYSDMQELLCAADILITDYSSCMFDMAIAGKPCILYVPDLDSYIEKERNLYFDISELPFPISKNMNELYATILNFDNQIYQNNLNKFIKKIGSYENGTASKQVSEYIVKNIGS